MFPLSGVREEIFLLLLERGSLDYQTPKEVPSRVYIVLA
jgi:hypothetical protein